MSHPISSNGGGGSFGQYRSEISTSFPYRRDRHDISGANQSFPTPRKCPSGGLWSWKSALSSVLWSQHQLWSPDLVSQADHPLLQNRVSNYKTPIPESPTSVQREKSHILSTLCMVGTLLMQFSLQACTFFIPSLISYVRTLGLGKLAHTAKCPGRGLSQVGQTPSSMLFPASQGQSSRFPSSLALALKDRKLSYVLEQKRNHAERRVQWALLSSSRRECYCQRLLKGPPCP